MESNIYQNKEIFSGWYYTYFFLAILYLIFLIVFLIFTRREFCSSNSLRWSKASFAILIIALFIKSAGYCSSGCIIIEYNKIINDYPQCPKNYANISALNEYLSQEFNFYTKIFMISSSIPGYMISAAYCVIFFSWCSICIEVMEKKSSTFYGKSRCVLTVLLIIILILSMVSFYLFFMMDEIQMISHICEAVCAVIRDLSLSVAFIIYLKKIWQIFEDPLGSLKIFFRKFFCSCCDSRYARVRNQESISNFINYESRNRDELIRNMRYTNVSKNSYEAALIWMCISIIFGLIVRAISIVIYTVITNYGISFENSPEPVCSVIYGIEFTKSYLVAFIVETVLSEFLPVLAIIIHRISQPENQRDTDFGF